MILRRDTLQTRSARRPSPALIVAMTALVVALAGTATALPGKNNVDKNDLKKGAVTKKAIKKGAVTKKAIKANAVTTKAIQEGAVTTEKLAAQDPIHFVGAAGEPPFGNGGEGDCIWRNFSSADLSGQPSPFTDAGFFKDSFGVVHLSGPALAEDGPGGDAICDDQQDAVIYTLPEGYRPTNAITVPIVVAGDPDPDNIGQILIGGDQSITVGATTIPAGIVAVSPAVDDFTNLSLEGVTFRVAGPGNAAAQTSAGDAGGSGGSSSGEGLLGLP